MNIKHKGLKRLYDTGSPRGVNSQHVQKLENILARLDAAAEPADMDLPSFRLHELKGNRAGTWAVTVRANWRVTFRFEGSNVADLDYEDYH